MFIFSDDFYALLPYTPKTLHWNLKSIADYFEPEWNNIVKYDRTSFIEIKRLDVWQYITSVDEKKYICGCWKHIDDKIKYTTCNIEEFKKEFFSIMDYYLSLIHARYKQINMARI